MYREVTMIDLNEYSGYGARVCLGNAWPLSDVAFRRVAGAASGEGRPRGDGWAPCAEQREAIRAGSATSCATQRSLGRSGHPANARASVRRMDAAAMRRRFPRCSIATAPSVLGGVGRIRSGP